MNTKRRSYFIIFGWILWSAAIVTPFISTNLLSFRSFFEVFLSVGKALWFWFFILGIGWKSMRWLHVFDAGNHALRDRLSQLLLSCGFGLGIFATIVLLVGIFVGVSFQIFFIALVVLAIIIGCGWHELLREMDDVIQILRSKDWKKKEVLIGLTILGIVCLQLPAALTPTLYPDTLRYHFGLTHVFEQIGKIAHLPDMAEANIASNWQMIYMPQLLLFGEAGAQVFNWMTLLLIAIAVALTVGLESWWMASFVLVSTPFLLEVAGLGNNDLGVVFFVALIWLSFKTKNLKCPTFGAGIFAGIAIGAKYNAGIFILAILIGYGLFPLQHSEKRWKHILFFGLGAWIAYLPWFIRNTIWTGDPFYPMMSHWLPWCGQEGRWVAEHYLREMSHYGRELEGWQRILFAPWTVAKGDSFESDLGIVYWCAIPAIAWAVWRQKGGREIRMIAASSFVGWLFWAIGPQVTRFLGPLIPSLALAVGFSWKEWMKLFHHKYQHILCFTFLGMMMALNIWQAMASVSGFSSSYLFQGITREQYLVQNSAVYRMASLAGKIALPESKVLLLGVVELFYFQTKICMSGPFDEKWIVKLATQSKSSQELALLLKEAHIDLICLDKNRMDGMEQRFGYMSWPSEEVRDRFFDFLNQKTRLLKKDGNIDLYRIL